MVTPDGTAKLLTRIVGSTYRGPEAFNRMVTLKMGQPLRLQREQDNPYDVNAVAVYSYSIMLGYLPRPIAARVAPAMDRGIPVRARKAGQPGTGEIELLITRRGFPKPAEPPAPPTVSANARFRNLDLD